ncbi:hypothetical protein CYMTET_56935 [Cymbomonas tetramitiformis]|uniref:Uncharacterized protein n=1 Tax=Cymbomonas tetramitiformis TaxID=36881 RepID=A0AAE0BBC4_9CHLO|nr:hypothetical protein CYMTET_56935 [Cymbomonas tetramitiformis]
MAVNPALTSAGQGRSFPRAFENEAFLLHREGLEMEVDIPSGSRKQSHRGILYVSNIRMVFVANQPTDDFRAFDIPLVYLRKERFNQPIFGCNNLTGDVFSVAGGGPNSSTPPYSVRIFFKEGNLNSNIASAQTIRCFRLRLACFTLLRSGWLWNLSAFIFQLIGAGAWTNATKHCS